MKMPWKCEAVKYEFWSGLKLKLIEIKKNLFTLEGEE